MLTVQVVCLGFLLLVACDAPDQQRLQKLLHQSHSEIRSIVVASHTEEKPEKFAVASTAIRDPFNWPQSDSARQSAKELRPFLERFALENLQLVGVISSGLGNLALVRSSIGVHPIRVGQRIGLNTGVVANIGQDKIDVDISVGPESVFHRQTLSMRVNQ